MRCRRRSQARSPKWSTRPLAQLPVTKDELTRYAQNVLGAADKYDATDKQLAEEILKRLEAFDAASVAAPVAKAGLRRQRCGWRCLRRGGRGVVGWNCGVALGPAGRRRCAAGRSDGPDDADAHADGAAGRADSDADDGCGSGHSASDDAGCAERHAAGRSAVGEVGRGEDGRRRRPDSGRDGRGPSDEAPKTPESQPDQAAAGDKAGERAPEQQRPEPRPEMPAGPKPAPTRPAESPEIAL